MSLLFFLLFGVILAVDVLMFTFEKYVLSFIIPLGSIIGAYYFMPDFAYFVHSDWQRILTHYVPIYFIIGILTAIIKWTIYNLIHVRWVREVTNQFDAQLDVELATNKVIRRKAFIKFYENGHYPSIRRPYVYDITDWEHPNAVVNAITPRAKDNVGLITIWIFQWPIVILSTIVSDLIVQLGTHVARFFDFVFMAPVRIMVAKATKGI